MVEPEKKRRVWILGAGFSYPLGAPLFHQLFSPTMKSMLDGLLNNDPNRANLENHLLPMINAADATYHAYLPSKVEPDRMVMWNNPEEFLQRLGDTHSYDESNLVRNFILNECNFRVSSMSRRLSHRLSACDNMDALVKVQNGAIIRLALEVAAFLHGNQCNTECWDPYKRWMHSLLEHGMDCLVTFNYDIVLEKLGKISGKSLRVSPGSSGDGITKPTDGPIPVYKLHGSVGWTVNKEGHRKEVQSIVDLYRNAGYLPEIYAPGPSKALATEKGDWANAMRFIRDADEIHIIGYRFPETDVIATSRILEAVRDGKAKKSIHIVLGPQINSPHIQRVLSLFEGLGGANCEIIPERRYAQDHLIEIVNTSQGGN